MSIWARTEARNRGFKIDGQALDEMRNYTIHDQRAKIGNEEFLSIYMHLASPVAPKLDDETAAWTKKISAQILSKQSADGSWDMNKLRAPPILDASEVKTMQALLALDAAHDRGLVEDKVWTSSRDRALAWLGKNKFLDQNQSLNLRLLVALRFGKAEEAQALVKQLLEQQNADGGWSQTRNGLSDSMATGQTLYALSTAGVSSQDLAVQRAQLYLINEQTAPSSKDKNKEPGFWQVNSRTGSKSLMTTTFGSGWATLGLMRTLPMQGLAPAK